MIKTKEQILAEQREKFETHLRAVKQDLNSLSSVVNEIEEDKNRVEDVAPEVFNILTGIQRDLWCAKDNINRIKRMIT